MTTAKASGPYHIYLHVVVDNTIKNEKHHIIIQNIFVWRI